MALSFPSSPSVGASYTDPNNVVWIFSGVGWEQLSKVVGSFATLNNAQTFSAGQRGAVTSVAYAASIALNLALSNNFEIAALTGNLTLANPTNLVAGQSGFIILPQDATGSRTISFGSYWKAPGGIASVVLSTAANSVDALAYYVRNSTNIMVGLSKAVA